MKKNVLLILLLFICSFGSIAQESTPPAMSSDDRTKMFVERITPKLNLTKGQKDSLALIFIQFMDDIQKYHAENNAKVITFMMKTRDEKVKNLLRDTIKYDKYLLVMEDIKKQREPQHGSMSRPISK